MYIYRFRHICIYIGSDICRGLLKFAEKKPLGKHGLYWLKVHLANLFGVNKLSFDARVAWADARLQKVLCVCVCVYVCV
jgi:DNA-directed RNA polymerase